VGDEPITVVLVDDHMLMREGLREILETQPDVRVVGEAGDSATAISVVAEHQPRVVLLDVEIPGGDVTDTVTALRRRAPNTEVIILSMYDGPHLVPVPAAVRPGGGQLADRPGVRGRSTGRGGRRSLRAAQPG